MGIASYKHSLGLDPSGQLSAHFPSYPKTGNTWLRLMLGKYIQLKFNLRNLPLLEGDDTEAKLFAPHYLPRMTVSHGPLTWRTQTADDLTDDNTTRPYCYGPSILIVRHPLDAILSNYMHVHHQAGSNDGAPKAYVDFLRDPVFGLQKSIRFHNLWAPFVARGSTHMVRYEDLKRDAADQLTRLLKYLRIDPDPKLILRAVDFASFDNMRAIEDSGKAPKYRSSGFPIFATGDRANPNARHVRDGKVGGYGAHLSADDAALFVATINRELDPVFGYSQ